MTLMASELVRLVGAIQRRDAITSIKDILQKFCWQKTSTEDGAWDTSADPLYQAILAGYSDAVRLLLLHSAYANPQQKTHVPYLHLACIHGHSQIIGCLLDANPTYFRHHINKKELQEMLATLASPVTRSLPSFCHGQERFSAVDVAAITTQVSCVCFLLSTSASMCKLDSLLERAVETRSVAALELLLETEANDQKELNSAFREALRKKMPECVSLLLAKGAKPIEALNNMNPYHVLYMYTSGYESEDQKYPHSGLTETTAALLEAHLDINIAEPFGSYPLYSLLHALVHECDTGSSQAPTHHISALHILLRAGADSTFDELNFAKNKEDDYERHMTVGRDLYTSGLNALFSSLMSCDTWRGQYEEVITSCLELLLQYAPDPISIVNSSSPGYSETSLHQLMDVIASHHASGHMHARVSQVVSTLLTHGADPSKRSRRGLTPVEHYFLQLCELMGGFIAFDRWMDQCDLQQVLCMLGLMCWTDVKYVSQQILHILHTVPDEGSTAEIIAFVSNRLSYYTGEPRSLILTCQLVIWNGLGRSKTHLQKLEAPITLKNSLLVLFKV